MLNLKPLCKSDILGLKPYFVNAHCMSCDYSLLVKYMWKDFFHTRFEIINNVLIMMEEYGDEKYCFYYPMALSYESNIEEAFNLIEEYVRTNNIPLEFCSVPEDKLEDIKRRYPSSSIRSDRMWADYIYLCDDLANYKGKKFSGQRNHVHRFTSLYPHYEYHMATTLDKAKLLDFFDNYFLKETIIKNEEHKTELAMTREAIEVFDDFSQYVSYISVDNKIIAFCIGEVVNDVLFVHIEKALREYEGVYPTLVKHFASDFTSIVQYINREDDSDDMGLRTSKMQYNPIRLYDKYFIHDVNRKDILEIIPTLMTRRLIIGPLKREKQNDYASLCTDDILNQLWGYDYKLDLKEGDNPTGDYFYQVVQDDIKKKESFSFIVYKNEELIGEIVLYNFLDDNSGEIGYRIKKEYQNKGYGQEAFDAVKTYALNELKLSYLSIKCFKDNVYSKKMIIHAKAQYLSEDDQYEYYKILN